MNGLKFYLNNNSINPPKNWRELSIEVNFEDSEFKNQQLSINDWDFKRENIDAINSWILAGRIFEGMPFGITQTDSNGVVTVMFDGYLDLSDDATFDEFGITVKSKPKYSIDWLNDKASGFSFDYLYSINVITQSDFVDIPYVISSIPDYEKLAITVIGLTIILDSLSASIRSLAGSVASILSASPDWGNIFILVGEILKFIGLMIAAVALVKRMFAVIIQKVKYHKGISIKRLFERGCQQLGLTFQSSIILASDHILPAKYQVPKNTTNPFNLDILGAFTPNEFLQYGFPNGTFADFIIKMKDLYNGKVLFDGTTLRFERKDFSLANPQYTLPNVINTKYTLNASDFTSNFFATFQTDLSEINTITQFQGTSYQVTITPQSFINADLVLTKGLKQVNFAYALGKRKVDLTSVERLFDNIAGLIDGAVQVGVNIVNTVVSVLNDIIDGINNLVDFFEDLGGLVGFDITVPDIPQIPAVNYTPIGSLLDDRIGMLLLEKDSFMVDKILRLEANGKLSPTQPSAKEMYDNFYSIDYFTQYKLQNWDGIPFTLQNFNQIRNNPRAYTPQGQTCDILSAEYNIWNERAEATIKTRTPFTYTTNLLKKYAEPTGE